MKEYGSNVQKLVEHIISIPDIETRTKHAHILIELMRQIHPQMRDGMDYNKKLWDDLYIMANFDLIVDSPFPPPPKEILGRKPMQIPYNQQKLKHRFYGRNVELLVLKAMLADTFDERKAFVSYLVRLMKSFFLNWNKDTIETNSCLQQILELSGYKLQAEIDDLRVNGLVEDASPRDGSGNRGRQQFQNFARPERNNERRPAERGNERNSRPPMERNGNGNNRNGSNNNNKNRFRDNNRRRP
ncbi:DUF4290 domain-containing protein [Emticicia sp. CRIBPO]|uniref:DUF4290 domain-containing protein n=1 Tax=Emticicia sp. CRIBPO TaxID=2683258 RepID=UPI001412187F|nr:DUF4290 domain-containing protein [Emticicia sp. CRIBPO]NBA84920.1 DUF4290 domain-containing protein [Emticicia sp. CRIBPO]